MVADVGGRLVTLPLLRLLAERDGAEMVVRSHLPGLTFFLSFRRCAA